MNDQNKDLPPLPEMDSLADVEHFSVEQARQHAKTWCAKHPAWLPICDLDETDQYYVQWGELSKADQEYWMSEGCYNEFATKRCKIETGFMSGKGEFHTDMMSIPFGHNLVMLFRVGTKAARAILAANLTISQQNKDSA